MSVVCIGDVSSWNARFDAHSQEYLTDLLEQGEVLLFPALSFAMSDAERNLCSPTIADERAKNISFDPESDRIAGTSLQGEPLEAFRAMMRRFHAQATELLESMLPGYAGAMEPRLASFRPHEIEGRQVSERKDDTRLHVDAFASRPNHGRRILRVFCNVNLDGKPRTWLLGEPFEPYARKFLPHVRPQWPFEAALLHSLGITKQKRTRYDHCMLQLHDKGKLSPSYQRNAARERIDFPAGSTWVCFTDQVLHAALAGQHLLEQTYLLPGSAMEHPERSPLHTLERLTGRHLT